MKQKAKLLNMTNMIIFRCGRVVRIPGFYPGGPGSITGIGTFFLTTLRGGKTRKAV